MSTIIEDKMGGPVISRDALAALDLTDMVEAVELANVTPGEILVEEFMRPLGLSARALARDMDVPANRITAILAGTRAITAETALRLSERFATSAEFWLHLQAAHDLEAARRQRRGTRRAGAPG